MPYLKELSRVYQAKKIPVKGMVVVWHYPLYRFTFSFSNIPLCSECE